LSAATEIKISFVDADGGSRTSWVAGLVSGDELYIQSGTTHAGIGVLFSGGSGSYESIAIVDASGTLASVGSDFGIIISRQGVGETGPTGPTGAGTTGPTGPTGATDASDLTYTPTTSADWDGGTDPGNADDALDQLAERVKDIEDAGAGHDALTLSATLTDILSLTGQELSADDLGADKLWFWDGSAGAMKPLTVGTGLTITGATITAISGSNPTGFVVATKGGSSQSVGSGGYGQVTFSTEVTDIDGDFASSSLTVASDEVWIISGVITVESLNTGALHQIALYKDGSFYLNLNIIGSWGSPEIALPFYVVVDSSGDYDIRFTTSSSHSKTINGDAQKTFIKCIRIR
jgi:hypothetical protein